MCRTTCFEIRLSPIALSVTQLPRFLRLVNFSLTTNARPADYPKMVGLPHPTCRRFLRAIATFKGIHHAVNNTPFGDPSAAEPADVEADESLYKATVAPPNPETRPGSP